MIWLIIKELADKVPATATAIVVGSGGGSTVRSWRRLNADRLVLVEADPALVASLRRVVNAGKGEEVAGHAVTSVAGDSGVLHVLNNRRYSSLQPPGALDRYLPNLKEVRQVEVPAEPITNTIAKLDIDRSASNLLVLNAPGQASALLESLPSAVLQQFSNLVVRCSDIPLYQGEAEAREILEKLHDSGFDIVMECPQAIYPERAVLLSRNESRIEVARLCLELERTRSNLAEAKEKIQERDTMLGELRGALDAEVELRTASAEEIQGEIRAIGDALSHKLNKATSRSLKAMLNGVDALAQDVSRKIDRSTTNAAKQVQAYIGVHEYLRSGELPSLSTEGHAWPISPDFAIFLLELLELNDYDVIIEFGSGYSTVIMARALARSAQARPDKRPAELVSFEHLEQYLARTTELLENAGVAGVSRLVHAPLEAYEAPNGTEFMYYACTEVMRELGKRYSCSKPRVLVVVDGPPGKTCKDARYPAAPIVLSCFNGRSVDFLMDDYGRADEQETVALWQAELSAAGTDHQTTILRLDKDACLLRVNPGRT